MTFRIDAAIALNDYTDEYDTIEESILAYKESSKFNTDFVKVHSFKYWADGTPLSYTSLLVEDYANRPDKGDHTLSQNQLELSREFIDLGKVGRFHSIGDGTTRILLNLVEDSRKAFPDNNQIVGQYRFDFSGSAIRTYDGSYSYFPMGINDGAIYPTFTVTAP